MPRALYGTAEAGTLNGGQGQDKTWAKSGADSVTSGGSADTIFAHAGDDTINSGAGADKVFGGAGEDIIDGGAAADRLRGGLATTFCAAVPLVVGPVPVVAREASMIVSGVGLATTSCAERAGTTSSTEATTTMLWATTQASTGSMAPKEPILCPDG